MSLQTDNTLSLPIMLAWFRLNILKIVLGGVVCALLSIPLTLTQSLSYNSSVTLMVSPPVFKDGGKALASRDPSVLVDSTISEMMPRALPVETYKLIALSAPVLEGVIQRAQLESTIQELKGRLKVELVRMGASGRITYSRAIVFHANARSPELAAKTAQAWAVEFKEHVDTVAAKGIRETFDLLDSLHSESKTELEQSEIALAEHRKLWNLELVMARVDAKQLQVTVFENELKVTEVLVAAGEMRVQVLEDELAKEPKKNVYFRSPSDDVYWLLENQSGVSQPIEPEQGLRVEQPNSNYVEIRGALVTAKADLEGSKGTKGALLVNLDDLQQEINDLSAAFSEKSLERTILNREHESLKASYVMVRAEYEKGRMANRTRASDIVITSEAVPLPQPGGPGKAKTSLLAAIVGMIALGGFLMLKDISELASVQSQGRGGLGALMSRASSSLDKSEDARKNHENSD